MKKKFTILYKSLRYDSVAQLDRVTDYESVGLGFESYRVTTEQLMHFA